MDEEVALSSLPVELLRHICMRLPSRDVARLCFTFRLAASCCDQGFRDERLAAEGISASGCSLELLALHEFLSSQAPCAVKDHEAPSALGRYTAQVGFGLADIMLDKDDGRESCVQNSRGRLRAVADALHMHPSAKALIDAHVGLTAPGGIAMSYSARRGSVIAAVLVMNHNIAVDRLRVRCWGKRVAKRAAKSAHPNSESARAGYGWGEVFLLMDGVELPARPDYYYDKVGLQCGAELTGNKLAAKVSDAAATLRHGHSSNWIAPRALPPPMGVVAAAGESEDEDSGEEESDDSDDSDSNEESEDEEGEEESEEEESEGGGAEEEGAEEEGAEEEGEGGEAEEGGGVEQEEVRPGEVRGEEGGGGGELGAGGCSAAGASAQQS